MTAEAKTKMKMRTKITAASERFRVKLVRRATDRDPPDDRARQAAAYSYWDDTPEVRFAGIWVGRALSRSRLFAAIVAEDGTIEEAPNDHPAVELVAGIAGGTTGQSQFLEQFGPHLVVAGEAGVVIEPKGPGLPDAWHVVPTTQTKKVKRGAHDWKEATIGNRKIFVPPAGISDVDDDAPVFIRIWNPHPADYARPDSPVMSAEVILHELRLLNAAVAAIARSRLVGRGILQVPPDISLPKGDDFMEYLLEVAEMAYADPESVAATVPIAVEVPKEAGEIKLISFASEFDELAIKLREEAIRRFATAADTPAEVLLGTGDINHWGVWAIKDEAIQVGVEPRLSTICDGLTRQWLQPLLEGVTDDFERVLVWYDTSALRVRTNRAQTAVELGGAGYLSSKSVRRETGFDEDDAPSPAQAKLTLMLRVADSMPRAPGTEDVQGTIARQLLNALDAAIAEEDEGGEDASPAPPGDAPSLPVDETDAPPDTMPEPGEVVPDGNGDVPGALAEAVHQTIVRALERAGARIKRQAGRARWDEFARVGGAAVHTIAPATRSQIDELTRDAWTRVPELAERHGVDEACLRDVLNEYARDLLLAGVAHSYDMVPHLLRQAACLQPVGGA